MLLGYRRSLRWKRRSPRRSICHWIGGEIQDDPIEGDPWQDDEGDDPFTVHNADPGGISGIVFVRSDLASWNPTAFLFVVRVKLGIDNGPGIMKVTEKNSK